MWQDIKNIYHLIQAILANIIFFFPGRGMQIIGVTGTDGKTTTASLLYHILTEAGYKTAIISTVSAIINGKTYDTGFHVTTPTSFAVQSYIRKAKLAGVKYLILESTSIGLHQNRVFGVPFTIGILTNITNEHIDYHKTYDKYVKAKARLFQSSKVAILNIDDKSYSLITKYLKNKKIITYGLDENTDYNPSKFPFETKMIGTFNIYNSLAAIAAAKELGIKDEVIRKNLKSFRPPTGREEIVYDKDFKVIIDFAHTPGSFEAILPEIKKLKTNNKSRIIHIFGCAGLRDHYKRPAMGKISSRFCDIIILTSEDPRTEDIYQIDNEIAQGILPNFPKNNLYKIPDRQSAINKAISLAEKGDIVITTGKAHESSMNYGQGEIPWNEHNAVKTALNERQKNVKK